MVAAISDWVKSIVMVVLFASFLELLLPASSMQRFVRVIMGLLVMLTILNPVVEFIQTRLGPEQVPAMSGRLTPASDGVLQNANVVAEKRSRLAAEIYQKDLAKQIRAVVVALDGVADARVAVELKNPAEGRTGAIEKITIYLQTGNTAAGQKTDPATIKAKISRTVRELYQLRDSQVAIQQLN